MKIQRGDLIIVKLDPVVGSEQGKTRPAVVIQNDTGNEKSPVTIIAPITSKTFRTEFPTNVKLEKKDSGLEKDSTILLNQIRVIDKTRITKKIRKLDYQIMSSVNMAIKISLGLD